MRQFVSVVNAAALAIAWGITLLLGAAVSLLLITVMSIIWAINPLAGFAFLAFILFIVWGMFYATQS